MAIPAAVPAWCRDLCEDRCRPFTRGASTPRPGVSPWWRLVSTASLSIIATALIDTGSKMDEVIFEEFKGTGNSEIVLDRKVSDKRIFPSLDVGKSGTRKEELLVDQNVLTKMWVLRRILMQMGTVDAMQFLLDKMKDSKTNEDFFASMNQ